MNLNSILIGSEDPKPLVEYYTKLFGDPAGSEGGYTWWQVGTGGFTFSEQSEVKGKNGHPGRVIWNIETDDVKGDFERLKAAGATVIQAPYAPDVGDAPEAPEMSVATFAAFFGHDTQTMPSGLIAAIIFGAALARSCALVKNAWMTS